MDPDLSFGQTKFRGVIVTAPGSDVDFVSRFLFLVLTRILLQDPLTRH